MTVSHISTIVVLAPSASFDSTLPELLGIKAILLPTETHQDLMDHLERLPDTLASATEGLFCVHIDAHGDHLGFDHPDGSATEWAEIHPHFSNLFNRLQRQLVLVLSACEGFNVAYVGIDLERKLPYFGIAGSMRRVPAGQFYDWYKLFYGELHSSGDIDAAARATNLRFPSVPVYAFSKEYLLQHTRRLIENGFQAFLVQSRKDVEEALRRSGADMTKMKPFLDAEFQREKYRKRLDRLIKEL